MFRHDRRQVRLLGRWLEPVSRNEGRAYPGLETEGSASMNAVVLVGGGGTRLRPLTYSLLKPLIPVVNKPLIAHIFDNLRRHGVEHVVLAATARDRSMEDTIGNGHDYG